jgi:hypothetical protein
LADNKLAINAGWDEKLLNLELGDLRDSGFNIDLIGFDRDELSALFASELTEGLTNEDEVPPAPEKATSQAGDLWILGRHRLLCGDATDEDHVAPG